LVVLSLIPKAGYAGGVSDFGVRTPVSRYWLPQEPLAVGTMLTQLYRVRGIRSAAGDEELHAAGLLV